MEQHRRRAAAAALVAFAFCAGAAACGAEPLGEVVSSFAGDASVDGAPDAPTGVDATSDADGAIGKSDAGLDAADAADARDAADSAPVVDAAPMVDAARDSADAAPNVCGDGLRDPLAEECDEGAANGAGAGCSAACAVQDFAAVARGADAGPARPSRTLGLGRHPLAGGADGFAVAMVAQTSSAVTIGVEAFDPRGVRRAFFPVIGAASQTTATSDPVLAALPGHAYAAVWSDVGGDGDAEGIAMELLDTSSGAAGAVTYANATTVSAQSAPDAVWTNGSLVVAWTDASNPGTAPDLVLRTFDASLRPTGAEIPLARTAAAEGDVALSPFNGTWGAAWRASTGGVETIHVSTGGGAEYVVGPIAAGPSGERPSLVQASPSTLLVTFTVSVPAADGGAGASTKVQGATIDVTRAPAPISPFDLPSIALPASAPAGATAGGSVWLSTATGAQSGDPNGGEVWLQTFGVDAGALPLPRAAAHRAGDQRRPVLAITSPAGASALVMAWEDYGAGEPDVVLQVDPLPSKWVAVHP